MYFLIVSLANTSHFPPRFRHNIEEHTGTRNQDGITFSFPTSSDEPSCVTTDTHQGSPAADTGKQTISPNPSEQQEMGAFLASTPTSLPPTEIPSSYRPLEIRRLQMNADYLPNENACTKERNQSSSTVCSSDAVVSEVYSESEEATHGQPNMQTPDKPVQLILPMDPASNKPRLFIEITSIENEGQSISSSSDQNSTHPHSPVARSGKTLSDAQAAGVHDEVPEVNEGEIGTGSVTNGSVLKGEASDMFHGDHTKTKKESKMLNHEQERSVCHCAITIFPFFNILVH